MTKEEDEEMLAYLEMLETAMLEMMEDLIGEFDELDQFARDEEIKYAEEPLLQQLNWHKNQIQLLANQVSEKMKRYGDERLTNREWGQ